MPVALDISRMVVWLYPFFMNNFVAFLAISRCFSRTRSGFLIRLETVSDILSLPPFFFKTFFLPLEINMHGQENWPTPENNNNNFYHKLFFYILTFLKKRKHII